MLKERWGMSIKQKLNISIITISAVLLITGIFILFGYRHVSSKASLSNDLDNATMYMQMMLRGVNEVIITESTPASVDIAKQGLTGFDEIHKKLIAGTSDKEINAMLQEKIDPLWQKVRENVKPFLVPHSSSGTDALMVKYGGVITNCTEIISQLKILSDKTRAVVNDNSRKSTMVQYFIILSMLSIIIAFIILSRHVYSSMLRPINNLLTISEGFSKGDLSIRMDESSHDEFASLAVHFNNAIENLSNIVSNVKSATDTLASNSLNLSAAITQIADNSRNQSSQATQAAAATEELNTSFMDVARNSANAAESAQKTSNLAAKGGEVVSRTINGMNIIFKSVKESANNIEKLGNSSQKIGEIVKVINDIAGQTNLLALNAAIEAARAGEQGRGFAVVADEVRKLAEKTTSATKEIVEMIQSIQHDTSTAVQTMQAGTKEVEAGVEMANEAGESLNQIVSSVQNVTDMIQQIATAAEQQSGAGRDIAQSLETVTGLTQQTAESAQHSSESTHNLNDLAHQLQQLVSGFKLLRNEHSNTVTLKNTFPGSISSKKTV